MIVKQGDLVQLKSGGPRMTVINPTSSREIWLCQWFNHVGNEAQQRFDQTYLQEYDANNDPGRDQHRRQQS